MTIPIWCTWFAGNYAVPRPIAQESAALIVLAVTLVVYRTFRERYLLIWILGWMAHLASSWRLQSVGANISPNLPAALSQAGFVLSVCLFSAAILLYSHDKKLLQPLFLAAVVVIAYAMTRALVWPDSVLLRLPLEVAYRAIALTAAIQLVRSRWGRLESGILFLAGSLLLLQLDWQPISRFVPYGFGLVIDLFLGTSMLLVVLDDSQMRTRRLRVIQTITDSMTQEQQTGPMMNTALRELKALMGSKAAWFRLVEGERMVLVQQIGLSRRFLKERASVLKDDAFERTFENGLPLAVKISSTDISARPYLRKEGFEHCILIPVLGKKSVIGTLTLGSDQAILYTPEEMDFLATTAHQLGLAVENLGLVEQILRSQRQWINTFDSIQDGVVLHDGNFQIMKANLSFFRRLGRRAEEVIGKTCEATLPKHGGNWKECPYCLEDEGFYEGFDPCFGGFSMVSTSTYSEEGSQAKGTIHVIRDVTDRHVAAEKYRMLFQQMQEGVFVATPKGQLLDCNEAFVRMLGYDSRDEVMVLNLETEMYVSAERRGTFRREVEAQNYVRNFEVQLRRKDGTLLTALESSFATRDLNGKIERYQGFLLDVSEKKQVEDEIRRRNRELNALNAMAMIASQSFDMDEILNLTLRQMILLLNAQMGSIYVADSNNKTYRRRADWGRGNSSNGRPAEVQLPDGFGELVTRSRTEVLTAEYVPHLPSSVSEFISNGEPGSWIWVVLWGKDQPLGLMGVSRAVHEKYTSNDENLLVATGRQLATTIEKVCLYEETCRAYEDLRQTQEQLLQSEKMSAVGQLIAGVAHELNNPLTAILGYAQLLEAEQLNTRAADFVAKLFRQAQRTHRVVQNLLSFARQRKSQKHLVDVCKVLEETLTLREYDLKVSKVELQREFEPSLPKVIADPHQLEQVFLNIINNAVDAMMEKQQTGVVKVSVSSRNGKVFIKFTDSGPGIKEPNRIFDPFYTTKSVGKGTGLGLSICYGIIKEHGGDISAHNAAEGGAILEVVLPSAAANILPESSATAPRHEQAVEGNILLVEDEEAMLEFERDVLTGAGAKVTTCIQTDEAQAKLLGDSYSALIINGNMPNWNTQQICEWLGEKCPALEKQVLITFSTVPDPEVRDFLRDKQIPYLVKPFEVVELITQARRLLQKTQSAIAG